MGENLLVRLPGGLVQRAICLLEDSRVELLQLGDADRQVLTSLRSKFDRRQGKRPVELQRGVARASLVDVQARAQSQLLAQQCPTTRPQQLGQTLLWTKRQG